MRNILSGIARIFDPLGFLEPIILNCKWIMQQCWSRKLSWDEPVPSDLREAWLAFVEQLSSLADLRVPRYVSCVDYIDRQLHGFSDASQKGYGACLYLRVESRDGSVQVRLLCSKGRVSPLKTQTIPRLELCGALALARLYDEVRGDFAVPAEKVYLWSDSTIVLQWLKKEPGLLQVFESNRVARIQELTGGAEWRHVRSEENPADAISRGQSLRDFLRNKLWFEGPAFLLEPGERWPTTAIFYSNSPPGLRVSGIRRVGLLLGEIGTPGSNNA